MKYLFIIPLLVSWNFLFWGLIGLARFLVQCFRDQTSIASIALLSVAVFALATPSVTTVITLLNYTILTLLVIMFSLKVPRDERSGTATYVITAAVAFLAACSWHFGSRWIGMLPLEQHSALIWFLLLLPVALTASKIAAQYSQGHGHLKDRLLSRRAQITATMVGYFGLLAWLTLAADLTAMLRIDPAEKSAQSVQGQLVLTGFYIYFLTVFPLYLISIVVNARQLRLHQHLIFVATASLILGALGRLPLTSGTGMTTNTLESMALSLGLPLLFLLAILKLTSTRPDSGTVLTPDNPPKTVFNRNHVAILVPAYNEGTGIRPTVMSAINLVGGENVFVVNDASRDNTGEILEQLDVNHIDLISNMGKARALEAAIKYFRLCERFEFLLILDADSEIDPDYLSHALPLFNDPEVSAVAGHAIPKWREKNAFNYGSYFVSYRIKLYLITQAFLRYGQTTRHLNVSFIIPGFSSIYRTRIIPRIDIAADGLVIEDFNMTFELHRKQLGRIAYSPKAIAYCHEPTSFRDYTSQIKRWHLGFWQTVIRHGLWRSRFITALLFFMVESIVISTALVVLPLLAVAAAIPLLTGWTLPAVFPDINASVFFTGVVLFFGLDYFGTVIVAKITRIPAMLWHGLFYFALRWLDALYFLGTFPMAFFVKSNGRWTSPARVPGNVS